MIINIYDIANFESKSSGFSATVIYIHCINGTGKIFKSL